MKNINIFCFGFGQVAKNFIKKLNLEKFNVNLSVTSRERTQIKKINKTSYNNYQFIGDTFDQNLIKKLKQSDHFLISVPPVNGLDLVIKNFEKIIEVCNPKWITYLSSTSVYGDHQGAWVDELSKTNPTSENGLSRLVSEKSWLTFTNKKKNTITDI